MATTAGFQLLCIVMRKLVFVDIGAILLLLIGRLYISGPIVMDREEAFHIGLFNTLNYLDQAKQAWAMKEQKGENDIPTMAELLPYLGNQKTLIDRFTALGVRYKITPFDEDHPQTEAATLTKDIRFRAGFCRFYPAGSKYSIQGERARPSRSPFYVYFQQNWVIMAPLWVVTFVLGNAIYLAFYFRGQASRTTGQRTRRRLGEP